MRSAALATAPWAFMVVIWCEPAAAQSPARGHSGTHTESVEAKAAADEQRPGAPLVGRRFGIKLTIGGASGGETLGTVDNTGTTVCIYVDGRLSGCEEGGIDELTAGGGIIVSAGFRYTPFWLAGHGLGFGLEGGIKVAANELFEVVRFPVVPSAHVFVRVFDPLYVAVAGGPVFDLGASLKFDNGVIEQKRSFETPIGAMVEAGPRLLWTFSDGSGALGIDLMIRYTAMVYRGGETSGPAEEYMPPARSFDASTISVLPSVELLF